MGKREAGDSTLAPTRIERFDVFLSHNSRDKPVVERIAEKLKRAGLDPWFDKWCLTPEHRKGKRNPQERSSASSGVLARTPGCDGTRRWRRTAH